MSKPVVLSMTALTGHRVRNTAGEDLGKLEELVLDEESGRLLYGVLHTGGFLGLGNRLISIPWKRLTIQPDHKGFILNIDKETLEHAPSFEKEYWPDMSLSEWRDTVETYFAYNPADEPLTAEGGEYIDDGPHSVPIEQAREEEGLAHRVEFELYAANAFDMSTVQVTARDGNITLEGRVSSPAESILANNIALTVDGVRNVTNNLQVSKAA
jgi:sporulation protein YlmC with PRC-barrel domain